MRPKKIKAWRWARNASLGVAGMLCLAACAGKPPSPELLTKIQVDRVTVPAALLALGPRPVVPTSRMQSAAANYIVRLKSDDDECHLDVGAIAAVQ